MDVLNAQTGKPYQYRARVRPADSLAATLRRGWAYLDDLKPQNAFGTVIYRGSMVWAFYDFYCPDCGGVGIRRAKSDPTCSACEAARKEAA